MIKEYVHKPIKVRAIQWTGHNINDFLSITGIQIEYVDKKLSVRVSSCWETLEINDYYYLDLCGEWTSIAGGLFEQWYKPCDE